MRMAVGERSALAERASFRIGLSGMAQTESRRRVSSLTLGVGALLTYGRPFPYGSVLFGGVLRQERMLSTPTIQTAPESAHKGAAMRIQRLTREKWRGGGDPGRVTSTYVVVLMLRVCYEP